MCIFLYAVNTSYGTLQICDEHSRTIATHPFSCME